MQLPSLQLAYYETLGNARKQSRQTEEFVCSHPRPHGHLPQPPRIQTFTFQTQNPSILPQIEVRLLSCRKGGAAAILRLRASAYYDPTLSGILAMQQTL